MAAWADSPPFSTIEMSRATAARSPARAAATSAAASYVLAKRLDGFDAGDAGDAVLQDPLHPALQREPGDGAGVARSRQLHLDDALFADTDEVNVAPVHLQRGTDGVDGLEDGCFHNRPAYRPVSPERSPG